MQKKNETNEKNPMSFIQKKIPIDITQLKTILNPNNNHGVCGSINLGNTCYMNSSIACLSNCTELTTFFLSKEYKTFKNTSNKNGLNGKLAEEWYSLLKDYWKTNKTHGNPKNIKNLVAKKDKKFEGYEQHSYLEEDLSSPRKTSIAILVFCFIICFIHFITIVMIIAHCCKIAAESVYPYIYIVDIMAIIGVIINWSMAISIIPKLNSIRRDETTIILT